MNKSTFFTGQPIFTQLLRLIPRDAIEGIARTHKADRYCKRFSTYEHLITMLYSVFNNCNSLREVTTGLLATEHRATHLGLRHHPRRSTLSDANNRRKEEVFAAIYYFLYNRYASFLSDSQKSSRASKIFIIDSTTISLFQEVLRGAGLSNLSNGKHKGGIKVHTLLRSDQDVPCMIRFTKGTANDSQFLKEVNLPKGSIILFDRGYYDFTTFNRFKQDGVTWVSRLRKRYTFEVLERYSTEDQTGILSDSKVELGWQGGIKVLARLIKYRDEQQGEVYEFISNNFKMKAETIAALYKKRWQIEMLFKRMKQNYPLKYFLGDSENAIKLQIWCSLIADLLLKIIKKSAAAKWSFSNLAAMIRLHLMTYIDLFGFLKSPEKALLKRNLTTKQLSIEQLLFET